MVLSGLPIGSGTPYLPKLFASNAAQHTTGSEENFRLIDEADFFRAIQLAQSFHGQSRVWQRPPHALQCSRMLALGNCNLYLQSFDLCLQLLHNIAMRLAKLVDICRMSA